MKQSAESGDDINAVDTNSIAWNRDLTRSHTWVRCPKRPRYDVFNDYPCKLFEQSSEHPFCKFEMRERRVDGFTYCTHPKALNKQDVRIG